MELARCTQLYSISTTSTRLGPVTMPMSLAFFLGVECPSSNVRSMGSPLTGDKFSLSNVGSTLLTYVVKSVPGSRSLFSLMFGGFAVTGGLLKNVMMVVAWVLGCSFFFGFLAFTFPGAAKSQFWRAPFAFTFPGAVKRQF